MGKNGISRETLVALHETEGIGWVTISALWTARRKHPVRAGMREGDLRDCGLKPKQAAALAINLEPAKMEARRLRLERSGIKVVTWADPDYPSLLKQTQDPPPVLYYIGNIELISRPAIAVVGTRLATAYGRHVAEQFSSAFADRGFAVVSGMAKGIDTCAHKGSLNRTGGTVAVLGTPVDQIYPPENRQLYREIAEKGLILSEAPPDSPYHTGMFPSRNRIIAGMSLGVLVAEAPINSGALITARNAIEASRPVFVIPGPVTSPRSRGGMALLKEGTAEPAIDPEDVMNPFKAYVDCPDEMRNPAEPAAELNERDEAVYRLLLEDHRSIDELAADTGIPLGHLHAIVLDLQMKKKIQRLPGSVYGAL